MPSPLYLKKPAPLGENGRGGNFELPNTKGRGGDGGGARHIAVCPMPVIGPLSCERPE